MQVISIIVEIKHKDKMLTVKIKTKRNLIVIPHTSSKVETRKRVLEVDWKRSWRSFCTYPLI